MAVDALKGCGTDAARAERIVELMRAAHRLQDMAELAALYGSRKSPRRSRQVAGDRAFA